MVERADGAHSRYLRNSNQSPMGADSLPPVACEFRSCRQQLRRVSIATAEYVGVWRLHFALLGPRLQGPSSPSTVSASPPSANGASAPYPRRMLFGSY